MLRPRLKPACSIPIRRKPSQNKPSQEITFSQTDDISEGVAAWAVEKITPDCSSQTFDKIHSPGLSISCSNEINNENNEPSASESVKNVAGVLSAEFSVTVTELGSDENAASAPKTDENISELSLPPESSTSGTKVVDCENTPPREEIEKLINFPDAEILKSIMKVSPAKKITKRQDRSKVPVEEETITGEYANKKTKRFAWWSKWDTFKFYRALNTFGPNFTMLATIFHNRDRASLKRKFKREEKLHPQLVDKVLKDQNLDLEALKTYFDLVDERQQETKKKKITSPNRDESVKRTRCWSLVSDLGCESVPSSPEEDVGGSRVTIVGKAKVEPKPKKKLPKIKKVPKPKKRGDKSKREEKKYAITCYL